MSFVKKFLAVISVLALFQSGAGALTSEPSQEEDSEAPEENPGRGVILDGLFEPTSGPCQFKMRGNPGCVHPDPSPPGVDVRLERSVEELQQTTQVLAPTSHVCYGDGTSGNRIQAIYAHPSNVTNRYNDVAPLIEQWAGHVEYVFNESARRAGGERHVRWVTNSDCSLSVLNVTLPTNGADTFGDTLSELRKLGYDDASRKYLVWMDARIYCGVAQLYYDDSPLQINLNNGLLTQYGRVDAGCWGFFRSAEAHELMHMLGGVQSTSPNATPAGHCVDEYDLMCYKDSAEAIIRIVCPDSQAESYFDCNNDDYFAPNPVSGSYLANHWNTASSTFLAKTTTSPDPVTYEVKYYTGRVPRSGRVVIDATFKDGLVQIGGSFKLRKRPSDYFEFHLMKDGQVVISMIGPSTFVTPYLRVNGDYQFVIVTASRTVYEFSSRLLLA